MRPKLCMEKAIQISLAPAQSKSFLCDRFFFHVLITLNVANVTNFYDNNQFLYDNFLTVTFVALFVCAISCPLLTFPCHAV